MERIDVAPDVLIKVAPTPKTLAPDTVKKVDAIWEKARGANASNLFNGTLYSVLSVEHSQITVSATEYKFFHAQLSEPTLFGTLQLRPLACTGILNCRDGLVFGQRSKHVTLDKGRWELAPSGVFDDDCKMGGDLLDAKNLLLKEAGEELGIPSALVQVGNVFAAFQDHTTRTIDLMLSASVPISKVEVRHYFETRLHAEYSDFEVVKISDLDYFVDGNQAALSSVTRATLGLRGFHSACSLSG